MAIALKASGKIEGTARKLFLNVLTAEDGKEGFPAYLNEIDNGARLPGHRVHVFVNGTGDNKWLTVSAPLRVVGEDGKYATQPRKNDDGAFLDDKGAVVAEEKDAALQFEYLRYKDGEEDKIVYGTIVNINIKNEKQDKTPTAFTLLNCKFYDDADALDIARTTFELKQYEDGTPERTEVEAELATMRKERGTWMTQFIEEGHEFLRNMGFEVREKEGSSPTPA